MSTSEFDPTNNTQHGIRPEDMPPLDDTAEVPMVHSEKVNSPKYWNDKMEAPAHNEKKGRNIKAIAGVASIAVAVGAGFGISRALPGGENSPEGPSTQPVATAAENPGNTAQNPGAGEGTNTPETPMIAQELQHNGKPIDSQSHWLVGDYSTVGYKKDIEKGIDDWAPEGIVKTLDDGNSAYFARRPIEDQLQYVVEKGVYQGRAYLGSDLFDQPVGGSRQDGDPLTLFDEGPAFNALTKKSTSDDILKSIQFNDQLANSQTTGNIESDAEDLDGDGIDDNSARDHEAYQKLLFGSYANPDGKTHQLLRDADENYPKVTKTPASDIANSMVIADDPNETKKSFDGVERLHRKIVVKQGADIHKWDVMWVPLKKDIDTFVGVRVLKAGENGSWVIVKDEMSDVKDF